MWKRLTRLWSLVRADARLLWFALGHPLAPRWLRPALLLLGLYLVSPIDLLPDTVPLLGVVDDLVLVPMLMAFIVRRLPPALRADYSRRGA